ncbi:hypothetical protein AAAC51_00015 [Priestia megaterium]
MVEKGKVIREKMYMTTKKDTSDEPLMFVVGVPLMKDNKPTTNIKGSSLVSFFVVMYIFSRITLPFSTT